MKIAYLTGKIDNFRSVLDMVYFFKDGWTSASLQSFPLLASYSIYMNAGMMRI